ncbi:MAG TPA: tRNA pseudouridine(38-40) synthase TruA [Burkholderiales bacterium]|jgi:tRNA pseudouridine38-40 synthase|nr:tRNA pseudouridine(38-40) synthase TruA [Burkholderiales bacterium]
MRIALGIEYDGSRFLGWQTQPGGGAVQDALEQALAGIAGSAVATTCAGRTDRGVHARAQVVHFDTDADRPESAWVRGVNALLPDSVAVLWARRVDPEFHARYSAFARTYRYVLLNRPVRPALAAGHVGWYHAPLDVGAMRQAAAALVGQHDFSAFRSSECQAKSPIRQLHELTIDAQAGRIDFVLRANAFLHHMVRNIVGTLVYVGKGKHPPRWAREVLESRNRAAAAPTFAAEGLYLQSIEYDPRWELPNFENTSQDLRDYALG